MVLKMPLAALLSCFVFLFSKELISRENLEGLVHSTGLWMELTMRDCCLVSLGTGEGTLLVIESERALIEWRVVHSQRFGSVASPLMSFEG